MTTNPVDIVERQEPTTTRVIVDARVVIAPITRAAWRCDLIVPPAYDGDRTLSFEGTGATPRAALDQALIAAARHGIEPAVGPAELSAFLADWEAGR